MLANGMHPLIKPLSIVEDCRAWQGSGRLGRGRACPCPASHKAGQGQGIEPPCLQSPPADD